MTREPRIVIIGAGIAGIATAVTLQRTGFGDFTILEKGSDVGGVWHWNRYPGLTCDVPSQLYQFSFAPKPDWTGLFAPGAEIQRYLRDVVDEHGLDCRLRLNTEVTSATFTGSTWQVTTSDGAELEADFLISATGVLHHPFTPDIPGLDSFAGEVVHTARWDDGVVTDGQRIAVIGTGSTGVQVVSALQPGAARISHLVRSPQWIIWAPMGLRQPAAVGKVLQRLPKLHRKLYGVLLWGSGILADIATRPSWRRRLAQAYARWSLRAQVRDPELRDSLTPDYQPLCKRQVVSSSYYRAIRAKNAELVTARDRTSHAGRHPDGRRSRDRRRPTDIGDRISHPQLHAAHAIAWARRHIDRRCMGQRAASVSDDRDPGVPQPLYGAGSQFADRLDFPAIFLRTHGPIHHALAAAIPRWAGRHR